MTDEMLEEACRGYDHLIFFPCTECACRDTTSTTDSGYICLVGGEPHDQVEGVYCDTFKQKRNNGWQ